MSATGEQMTATAAASKAVSTARTLAVLLATAGLAILAACSGGSSGRHVAQLRSSSGGADGATNAEGSTASPTAVAYSACMRSHGVPNFPDPGGDGQIPKGSAQQFGVGTSQYQAAQRACQHLIPNTGSTQEQQQEARCMTAGDCSPAVVQQWMSGLRTLARCLRTHGEPNWPDPVINSHGLPHYPYEQAGIDHHSSPVLARVQACVRLTGFEGLPLP